MISRLTIFALMLASLRVASAFCQTKSPPPVIHFSFYAPIQSDSPVRIVGLENDKNATQFMLSNATDKPVVGVVLGIVEMTASGCALVSQRDDMDYMGLTGAGYELRIAPHGKAVALRSGIFRPQDIPPQTTSYPRLAGVTPEGAVAANYAEGVVFMAQTAQAAHMQIQFGVTGVFFEDGTTWPAQLDPNRLPAHPFDPKLVENEAEKCTNVAAVANALQSVEEVVFEKETPPVPDTSDDENTPPHLRFSCSLEGAKAVCRLPLVIAPKRLIGQSKARGRK